MELVERNSLIRPVDLSTNDSDQRSSAIFTPMAIRTSRATIQPEQRCYWSCPFNGSQIVESAQQTLVA
jgi:hypothetical protein